MKKFIYATAVGLFFNVSATNAGEYLPYVGFDYVNRTLNVAGIMPDNYDIANINAGIKFVDLGAVEIFTERSLKEKKSYENHVSRGRLYGYGLDLLVNGYNFTDGAILGSVGYERMSTKLKYDGGAKKDDANVLRLGFGGELNPTPDWGLRAMFRYSLSDGDNFSNSKEFSVGARYYFY